MKKMLGLGAVMATLTIVGAVSTLANEPAPTSVEQLVSARQGGMVMSVFTLGRLSAAANSDKPLSESAFPARGLANFARSLPALFASETQAVENTHALASVWEKPAEFSAAITEYQAATGDLQTAIADNNLDAYSAALARTKAACKACHDSFRLEP